MAQLDAALAANNPPPANPTYEVPVRVTVFYDSDPNDSNGNGFSNGLTYTFGVVQNYLNEVNLAIENAGGSFTFSVCGDINDVYVDQLHKGELEPSNYSSTRNQVNLYIYDLSSTTLPGLNIAHATLPYGAPDLLGVWMPYDLSSVAGLDVFIHAFGHSLGLLHTFEGNGVYDLASLSDNVNTAQPTFTRFDLLEHPYTNVSGGFGGRELVIREVDNSDSKYFPNPNSSFGGDRVFDTPAACNPYASSSASLSTPSAQSVAECFDNDPNTICVNHCENIIVDPVNIDPSKCSNGCNFDFDNCRFDNTAVDYNGDILVDPDDVIAKNYMSYNGSCGESFTPGQISLMEQVFNSNTFAVYEPELCGTLSDYVELNGSDITLDRVNMKIESTFDDDDFTLAVVNLEGKFNGKLITEGNQPSFYKASVRRYREDDIQELDDSGDAFRQGVSTYDIFLIKQHILGIINLDGYQQVAADVNGSNSVTTLDIVDMRKLILYINESFLAFDSPRRFIPEGVTHNLYSNTLQSNFDGGSDDNAFLTNVPGVSGGPYAPSDYCSPDFVYRMRENSPANGFDAVKLGDVNQSFSNITGGNCGNEFSMLTPKKKLEEGTEYEVDVYGYNFEKAVAYQLELAFDSGLSVDQVTVEGEEEGEVFNLTESNLRVISVKNGEDSNTGAKNSLLFSMKIKSSYTGSIDDLIGLSESSFNRVYDNSGSCIKNATLEMRVKDKDSKQLSISSGASSTSTLSSYITVSPNPANGRSALFFDMPSSQDVSIIILDQLGNPAFTRSVHASKGRNSLRLAEADRLKDGVYTVIISTKLNQKVGRFVVAK